VNEILVIDDQPVNLRLMRSQLSKLGYQCDTTSDATQGFALWENGNYRLVITDCHMPGLDGFELARQIRGVEALQAQKRSIAILAWTADAMADNARLCREAGMNGCLVKPTLLATLQQALDEWLPARRPEFAEPPPSGISVADIHAPGHPKAAKAEAASATSPLDERALQEFSGGDIAEEREILLQFLEVNATDMQTLSAAISERDSARARLVAHRIKGVCRVLGAVPLGDVLERVERACLNADWPAVETLGPIVKAEQNHLLAYVKDRLNPA